MNSSVEGPRVRQLLFPLPSTRVLGPTASLGPACPAKGLPRPPRKHLEPLGSDGPCHGTPPIGAARLPPFLSTLLPHLSCPRASRTRWSPGGPFPDKAPSLWGEASLHLTEGICPFISLAKNKLSSGMCQTDICSSRPKFSKPPAQSVA